MSSAEPLLLNGAPTTTNVAQTTSTGRRSYHKVYCCPTSVRKRLCKICGEPAIRYFYGVLSCLRCKTFYSRGIGKAHKYKCVTGKRNCLIASQGGKMCRRCKFDKCVKSGMTCLGVKLTQRKSGNSLPLDTPPRIVALYKAYTKFFNSYNRKIATGKLKPLLLSDSPLEKGISSYKTAMFSQLCSFYQDLVADVVLFSRVVPGFKDLPWDDQLILIKTGFIEIWSILNAPRLSLVQDSVTLADGTHVPICEVTTIYTKEYVTSIMDLSDDFKTLKLQPSDRAVLIALVLICPERPNLMNKSKVNEVQELYIAAMKEYASYTRPTTPAFSKNLLSLLSNIRDIGKQHSLLLNMYRNEASKLSVSAVIRELFDLQPLIAYKES